MPKKSLVVIAYLCVAVTYVVFLLPRSQLLYLTKEDHLFENVGTLSCLLASIIFFVQYFKSTEGNDFILFKTSKNTFFLLFAIVLFFLTGEEISWGQRILHVGTPESWAAINAQKELNIHNLTTFDHSLFLNFNFLLNAAIFLYCGIIPLIKMRNASFDRFLKKINLPLLPMSLCLLALLVILSLKYIQWTGGHTGRYERAVGEVKESNLEFLFMIWALWFWLEKKMEATVKKI